PETAVDGRHLLAAIAEYWTDPSMPLLLSVRSAALLGSLLEQPACPGIWIEVADAQLADRRIAAGVHHARAQGVHLVWVGDDGETLNNTLAPFFHKTMHTLSPQDALAAMRLARRPDAGDSNGTGPIPQSPIVPGSLYVGLANRSLLEHALDRQHIWGAAGWPTDEILYDYRLRQIQPSRTAIRGLLQSIDADESLEALARHLGCEPLLTYRFLRYANSALLGHGHDVGSVRQGLMLVGYTQLRGWLTEQMNRASTDANLEPQRWSMVTRARVMEHLSDAGLGDDLRREVFLCGLLSQLDVLQGEPLGAALHRLPLPGRIVSAVLGQTGPYAAWLEVASALEGGNTRLIHDVCRAHKMPASEVNHALLRTLAMR
ncbi:MAG: HDOD domain-containing protein, partial [Rhodoferax sp.]|nr:HDOD domain-containing protein [Rhodoferax sp.]